MKVFCQFSLVFLLTSITSACSIFFGDSGMFRSRGKDYLASGPIKPIAVPDDMQVTSLEELYVVPKLEVKDEFGDPMTLDDYDVPRPKPYSVDKSGVAVKIQSQLGNRWIFLNASTAQVWPQTQSFLSENGILVTHSDASKGVIETEWVRFKADLDNQSRFRIEIKKGIHPDTTEVHVRQVQLPVSEQASTEIVWPDASDNPEREKYIVDQLANSLAANVDNKAASLMGQNVGGEERVTFASVGNEPRLNIRMPWNRAYASLAASLKSETFQFWDQDGDKKVFYLNYQSKEAESKSWISKLAFWSDDEDDEIVENQSKAPYSLEQVLHHLDDSPQVKEIFEGIEGVDYGQALSGAAGFLVLVETTVVDGEEVQGVIVRDYRGQKVPAKLSKDMLRLVRSNLI